MTRSGPECGGLLGQLVVYVDDFALRLQGSTLEGERLADDGLALRIAKEDDQLQVAL